MIATTVFVAVQTLFRIAEKRCILMSTCCHFDHLKETSHTETTLSSLVAVTLNGKTLCVPSLPISAHNQRVIAWFSSETTILEKIIQSKTSFQKGLITKAYLVVSLVASLHHLYTNAKQVLVGGVLGTNLPFHTTKEPHL